MRRSAASCLLDLLIGVVLLALMFLGVQFLWQYWGSSLDVVSTAQRIERVTGWKGGDDAAPAAGSSVSKVADPRYSTPPVEAAPAYGGVVGRMYMPRLGSDWSALIQEGTGQDVLDNLGLGHYESSVMPGGLGAAAFAGHRHPASLWDLDLAREGDAVVIRTHGYWYVYRIQRLETVEPEDVGVLDPVAGQRTLVLTTCDPKFSRTARQHRLIAFAVFDYWAPAADGTPRELGVPQEGPRTVSARIATMGATVSRVTGDAPVTPFLAVVCLTAWLVLDAAAWLLWRGRSLERLRSRGGWFSLWNPLALVWRLQAGVLPVRLVLALLLALGVVFACFAWACPWAAVAVPWLETPHPTMG